MARSERSAGFVLFFRPPGDAPATVPEYLLLDYGRHWDFPKGHVHKDEDDLAAALRELEEETGVTQASIVPGFHHELVYHFRDRKHGLVRKTVVFFLASTDSRDVRLSHEHVGYEYLPYELARKRLTFAGARQLLQSAHARVTDTASPADATGQSDGPSHLFEHVDPS